VIRQRTVNGMKISIIQQPAAHIKKPCQFGTEPWQASRFQANNATMTLAVPFDFQLRCPSPDE
jgi:hypothetical protein